MDFAALLEFDSFASTSTITNVGIAVLASFVFGQVVAWLYSWTHRGMSYSVSMTQALIVLTMIVALVMVVVGNSLARAFGLFGALALIRFRTPIKDARDAVFLFYAVALGIATGTGYLAAAFVGMVSIGAVLVYLHLTSFGARLDHDGLIRFRCPADEMLEHDVRRELKRYCDDFSLLHVREAGEADMEYAFQIRLIDPSIGPAMVGRMRLIDGVHDLSLLMQGSEGEV